MSSGVAGVLGRISGIVCLRVRLLHTSLPRQAATTGHQQWSLIVGSVIELGRIAKNGGRISTKGRGGDRGAGGGTCSWEVIVIATDCVEWNQRGEATRGPVPPMLPV